MWEVIHWIAAALAFASIVAKGLYIIIQTRGYYERDKLNRRHKSRLGNSDGDGRVRNGNSLRDDTE